MSVFKTTFSRALKVYPSNDANIPYPTVIVSGTNIDPSEFKLEDSAATFITDNVKQGDIVYNITNGTAATVVRVSSETLLALNADIFASSSQEYVIYQASIQTGFGSQGCYLYIGETGGGATSITVTTIGGDFVTFDGLSNGTILPVQVISVDEATTASKIVALW